MQGVHAEVRSELGNSRLIGLDALPLYLASHMNVLLIKWSIQLLKSPKRGTGSELSTDGFQMWGLPQFNCHST